MKLATSRYRHLFHALIVILFVFPWPLIGSGNPEWSAEFASVYWVMMMATTIPFYFINCYGLVPRYLAERKYKLYILLIAACLVANIILRTWGHSIVVGLVGVLPPFDLNRLPMNMFPMLLLLGLGTSFELILHAERRRQREEQLEHEKIFAELSFLKNQINPHFLFNALNNIFSLAQKKSEKTAESVLLLSQLIRYILYETGQGKISLLKEIRHAENYIDMQKLRILNSRNISVSFTYDGNIMFAKIEPLLLIPFIENAFKHGLSYSQPCSIAIDLHVNDEQLLFKAVNTKRMTKENINADTNCFGIGIANTKRRLELAYKGRYTLEINDAPDLFTVQLSILLCEKDDWVRSAKYIDASDKIEHENKLHSNR
jgi:two-component system LytT family sensor kinase